MTDTLTREPTADETAAVRAAVADLWDDDAADAAQLDDRLFVVPSYSTDGPGYSGPVAVLLDGDGGALVFSLRDGAAPLKVEA